jgi:hypothetical protein
MTTADQRAIRRECYAEVVAFLEGLSDGVDDVEDSGYRVSAQTALDEALGWAKEQAEYWRAIETLRHGERVT